jgi:hypothetical protein
MDTAFFPLPAERPYRIIVQNNPVNLTDPFGLYGWEVHFYKTYTWAREEGIEHNMALAIAEANQEVDEGITTHSASPLAWSPGGLRLHFSNRGNTELEMMQCVKMRMVKRFGAMLHNYQDSFSHLGVSPLKHLQMDLIGTSPDTYSESSPRDKTMEQGTRNWLREFKKSLDSRPFK